MPFQFLVLSISNTICIDSKHGFSLRQTWRVIYLTYSCLPSSLPEVQSVEDKEQNIYLLLSSLQEILVSWHPSFPLMTMYLLLTSLVASFKTCFKNAFSYSSSFVKLNLLSFSSCLWKCNVLTQCYYKLRKTTYRACLYGKSQTLFSFVHSQDM